MNHTLQIGGVAINRLGFGAMRIAGETARGAEYDRQNALAVLRRAVELGVNFIDTADVYGPEVSENLIHEALHPYKNLVVATKGGLTTGGGPGMRIPNGSPAHLRQACEASLKRLGVEQITLYQFHRPDPNVPFVDSVQALFDLKREGKIRCIGLSNITAEQLQVALQIGTITSVQNSYSLLDRQHEDVLKLCEQNGIAFIPYFPMGGSGGLGDEALGRIAGKYNVTPRQVGLAWLLGHSPVIVPIPGTSSVEHLEENMRAADITLGPEDTAQLNDLA